MTDPSSPMGDREDAGASAPTVEELDRATSLRLLAGQVIGRVAVAERDAAPLVVPVNFVLLNEWVIFRTDYGSKFRLAVLGERPVAFEVDEIDPGRRTGWSVVIDGSASELAEWEASALDLRAWAPGHKAHSVKVVPASAPAGACISPSCPTGEETAGTSDGHSSPAGSGGKGTAPPEH
jgi:uncharacterized protein